MDIYSNRNSLQSMTALIDYDSLIYKACYKILSIKDIRDLYKSGKQIELDQDQEIRFLKDRYKERWNKVKITKERLQQKMYIEREIIESALNRISNMYDNLLLEIESSDFMKEQGLEIMINEYFITTCQNSIRKKAFPDYKSGRAKYHNPMRKWVSKLREYCVNNIFIIETGYSHHSKEIEADDLIAIRAKAIGQENCIIVSIDKDLRTIPGLHFSYYRKPSKEVDEQGNRIKNPMIGMFQVSEDEAAYMFYYQMIVGDAGDSIKGLKGKGEKAAKETLDGIEPGQYENATKELYKKVLGEKWLQEWNKNKFLLQLGEKHIDQLIC